MKQHLAIGALVALAVTLPQSLPAADAAKPAFVIPQGTQDATKAIAGNYTLDPNHVAVMAGVPHMGFSVSMFRFGKVQGKLVWNPSDVAKSTLSATVETASIETNVPNFAEELSGPQFLDVAQFPQATFVSTTFRQSDATHGQVDGTFTLKGKSIPVTFAVTLVGAGPGFAGSMEMGHVIGIHAETTIKPDGLGLPAMLSRPITISIDTEFDRKAANNK